MRALAVATLLAVTLPAPGLAAPEIVWVSEPAGPGDVVLLQGDGLDGARDFLVWRVGDGDPGAAPAAAPVAAPASGGAMRVPALQPSGASAKLVLPSSLPPGIFAVDAGGGPRLIGRPRVEWTQPTRLAPGLGPNEAPPGASMQIIGRNFAGASGGARAPRVALRGADGRETALPVTRADRYAIVATLPGELAPGEYALWVHNGFGGSVGWGGGLRVRVRRPTAWPAQVVNVRELGARGDNVTDDSDAFRRALEAAERRGGGVVLFPAGTYRLAGVFRLPRRVVLRGEGKDLTWLKWPLTAPRAAADFVPAVLATAGEVGIERLSLMVRNAQTVVRGQGGDGARDVFLREIRVHYLPWAGRPAGNPQDDPQWAFSRWGIINGTDKDLAVFLRGINTLEVSDSEFVGAQRFLDARNARFVGNHFGNPMGVAWTDVGGQHIVFERNHVEGASSWRPGALPLRWIYGADNTTRNLGRGEREAFTFDVNRGLGMVREGGGRTEPWVGGVVSAEGRDLRLAGGDAAPGAYRGFDALIVSGRGAGQYREVDDSDGRHVRLAREWEVAPDTSSVVLLARVMGHCVFQRNAAQDVSVLLQMWGPLYDCTFDGNTATRSQGMWGLGGWRIQWLGNTLDTAVTYQSGIGPTGPTPDRTADYGYLGFTLSGRLAETARFEYVRGAILRGNRLTRGHRVLVMWGYGGERRQGRFAAARDVVVDANHIAHTPVGIELDANVEGAVVAGNVFTDVEEPLRLHAPGKVLVLTAPSGGTGGRR
jgi:hypothetical protein